MKNIDLKQCVSNFISINTEKDINEEIKNTFKKLSDANVENLENNFFIRDEDKKDRRKSRRSQITQSKFNAYKNNSNIKNTKIKDADFQKESNLNNTDAQIRE